MLPTLRKKRIRPTVEGEGTGTNNDQLKTALIFYPIDSVRQENLHFPALSLRRYFFNHSSGFSAPVLFRSPVPGPAPGPNVRLHRYELHRHCW